MGVSAKFEYQDITIFQFFGIRRHRRCVVLCLFVYLFVCLRGQRMCCESWIGKWKCDGRFEEGCDCAVCILHFQDPFHTFTPLQHHIHHLHDPPPPPLTSHPFHFPNPQPSSTSKQDTTTTTLTTITPSPISLRERTNATQARY